MNGWENALDHARLVAKEMHEAREVGLAKTRQLIQTCSKCIRHVHRHQFQEADLLLDQAKKIALEARQHLEPHPELYYAGYLQDAEKEMVEAAAVLALVLGRELPSAQQLGCGVMPYLNGMGEAASEVRRYALDEMRAGSTAAAEEILQNMETIYDDLITFDYPDAMTNGLRRTCDALRAVVERTRSDLTATASQRLLVEELRITREAVREGLTSED